jgi:hypothetical protein
MVTTQHMLVNGSNCIGELTGLKAKPSQIKSNQIKSNQIKSNQIKSNQIKSNTKTYFIRHKHIRQINAYAP